MQLPVVRSLSVDQFERFTGITSLQATIAANDYRLAELGDLHTEQTTTLVNLTAALGPIHGDLLQDGIEIERLKQANADNSMQVRAAQVRCSSS